MDPVLAALRRHPVWARASSGVLTVLAQRSRQVDRAAGQVFVVERQTAEHIYLLTQGTARIFYPARKGRPEVMVKLMMAPDGFGDVACALRGRYTATVEALTPSSALAIEAPAYFAALQREPTACFRQYWDVVRRFAGAVEGERAAHVTSVLERVVAVLLAYAAASGGLVELAQDDVAQQIGSNRRSVVRAITRLYATGGLQRRGRRYEVVDRARLLSAVSAEVPDLLGTAGAAPWAEL